MEYEQMLAELSKITGVEIESNADKTLAESGKLNEFTEEQWKAILGETRFYNGEYTNDPYEKLFSSGFPSYDYGYREHLFYAIKKNCTVVASDNVHDTWDDGDEFYCRTAAGVCLLLRYIHPRLLGTGGRTYYQVMLIRPDQMPKPNTHTAIILYANETGYVHIGKQHTGPLDECEDWLAKNFTRDDKHSATFKIVELQK